jgi:uncharacterized protein (DUF1778 family)
MDIECRETIVLSEHDRGLFFDVLGNPPTPGKRLERAFKAERDRVEHDGC